MKTQLSPIVAGTMNWGIWDKKLSTSEMIHLINICIENKISTFDHADIYGSYTTEAEFGKAFAESKIAREKIQLISKCGIQLEGNRKKIPTRFSLDRRHPALDEGRQQCAERNRQARDPIFLRSAPPHDHGFHERRCAARPAPVR